MIFFEDYFNKISIRLLFWTIKIFLFIDMTELTEVFETSGMSKLKHELAQGPSKRLQSNKYVTPW